MIFKSFSHISRHAALAKSLWATSSGNPQPAFFAKTNHLARQQSQLAPRNNPTIGPSDRSTNNSTNPSGYSALCNSSSFSTLSPLATLDDDKRREAILAESTGSSGSRMIHNHQHSLAAKKPVSVGLIGRTRRCSTSSLDNDFINTTGPERLRRYSVSRADLNSHMDALNQQKPKDPHTPPSSPTLGPINASNQLVEAELDLLKLEMVPPMHSETSAEIALSGPHSNLAVGATDYLEQQDQIPLEQQQQQDIQSSPSASPSATSLRSSSTQTSILTHDNHQIKQVPETHAILYSQLKESLATTSIPSVLASYQLLQSHNFPITTEIHESVLAFLSSNILNGNSSQNLNNVLSIYMDIVSKSTPTRSIYASVISSLLTLANHTILQKETNLAYSRLNNRHPRSALPAVLASQRNGDSSASLYKAALDIFEASNSVKPQRYAEDLYQSILEAIVATGSYSMLYPVTKMFELNNYTLNADILATMVKGYGKHGDIKAAVECYKHYKALSHTLVDRKEYHLYAALVGAYFDAGSPASGLIFLNKVLETTSTPSALAPVVAEIVDAYCRTGDYSSALAWIKHIENNPQFPSVTVQSLETLLSASCDANDFSAAATLFDAIRSRNELSNVSRSEFISLCAKSNETSSFLSAIEESRFNNGVWDLSTVVMAVKYLIEIGDLDLAFRTLDTQGKRYLQHLAESKLDIESQSVDAVNHVVRYLQSSGNLTLSSVLNIMESELFDAQVFSDDNGGGIACIQTIWDSQTNGDLDQVLADAPYTIVNIVDVHLKWIQASGANNSLGGLSIPTPLLESLRKNFSSLVHRFMSISPSVDIVFKDDVSLALSVLGDEEISAAWTAYCTNESEPEPFFEFDPIPWNQQASQQILSSNNSTEALGLLNDSIANGDLISPNVFVSLIDNAALAGEGETIKNVYKMALASLPRPSDHPDSLDAWVPIHQAVVRTANISYPVASAAYDHLVNLGAYPDATGYAQLISNAPAASPNDEASDAVWMFNEAKANSVVLNTLLYNVLLSKLSKASRLKEAITFFKDMSATNTKKNSVTYSTMINASYKCGDENAANAFFSEMENSPGYSPKIAPFNIMLQYYVHTKRDRTRALDAYSHLRSLGIRPSSLTYKLVIDAYSTIEPIDINAADKVLLEIVADGSAISTKHYASLIFARGVCMRNVVAAHEFYLSLLTSAKLRPDKYIFQALLESYVFNKQVRAAATVLDDMVTFGVDLDVHMADILIRGWAPVNMAKARGLFQHLLAEGIALPSSFESMVLAHLFYGDITAAYDVLNLMAAQMYDGQVIAKVQSLIEAHSLPETRMGEDALLDSIFKHNLPSHNPHKHTTPLPHHPHHYDLSPQTPIF